MVICGRRLDGCATVIEALIRQQTPQMGVYEERNRRPSMHWPQSERYTASDAYEPSCDASPGVPRVNSPSSPRMDCRSCHSSPRGPSDDSCAGCGGRIMDRYLIQAVERRWHANCLRCCECKIALESELTCYARDGNIFCKKDYVRLYGTKRCARCQAAIGSTELVMRARDLVYHVRCFSCALCSTPLNKGDTYGIRESSVYCRLHYETIPDYTCQSVMPGGPSVCPGQYSSAPQYLPYPSPDFPPGDGLSMEPQHKASFYNGVTAPPPRQKGRPRKKKPKDLDSMSTNMDLSPEYMELGFRGSGGLGGSSRTKRMRTSFKHHQLRTMKSYFAVNHNPDAKDLKQLSQKTGLPKRVLQVWFQNARAKWRRLVTKQEGKLGSEKYSPDGELDGGAYSRGPHSLPPHSPAYSVLGAPSSPNSMDCV